MDWNGVGVLVIHIDKYIIITLVEVLILIFLIIFIIMDKIFLLYTNHDIPLEFVLSYTLTYKG